MVEEILCDAPHNSKIVNDEIIFVQTSTTLKIAYGRGNFVRC